MTRAAILARVSTASQAEADRMSLPMQRERIERFAAERGWPVVAVFELPGESAFKEHRPQFMAAIAAAERREFDALLVYDVSRFARNQWVLHDTLRRLRACGVRVVEVLTGSDLEDDPMVTGIRGALAEAESMRQSRRIQDAKAFRFRLGLHVGDLPFGYERGASTIEPARVVRHEAAAIVDAFTARASRQGYAEIARSLNLQGLRPRSKRGHTSFSMSSVQSLLENDFYAGWVRHKGERAKGAHEAIISDDLWALAQSTVRTQPPRAVERRLLTGLARCVKCGSRMWTTRSGRANKFTHYREGRSGCEPTRRWRAEEADAAVEEVVRQMAMDDAFLRDVERQAREMVSGPTEDEAAVSALRERKARATRAYLAGELGERDWREMVEDLNGEMSRAKAPRGEDLAGCAVRLAGFGEAWDLLDGEGKREAVGLLFEAVGLDVTGKEVWVRPWAEWEGLFGAREEWVLRGGRGRQITPGRNRTVAAYPDWRWVGGLVA